MQGRPPPTHSGRLSSEKGQSLVSLLVELVISVVVFGSIIGVFFNTSKKTMDHQLMSRAQEDATSLIDLMSFELRLIGSGMPLGQANFQIADATLGDAPLPILTSATANQLTVRYNENGSNTVTTGVFTPAAASLLFTVLSTSGFSVGDTIYLSNFPTNGTFGLKGTIQAKTANSLTINNNYVASAGASFPIGTLVSKVSTVIYNSTQTGITKSINGGTATILAPKSSFSLQYLDKAGAALVLPLTDAAIKDNLTSLRLTVNVNGEKELSTGKIYTATVIQDITLRNLIISRY